MSPDGGTDYFKITAGVMQGDTLAPFFLVIVLDYALRKAIDGRELGRKERQKVSPSVHL